MVRKTGEAFGMDFTDWIVQLGVAFLLLNEIFVISKRNGINDSPMGSNCMHFPRHYGTKMD